MNFPLQLKFDLGNRRVLEGLIDKTPEGIITYTIDNSGFDLPKGRSAPVLDAITEMLDEVSEKSEDGIVEVNIRTIAKEIFKGFGIGSANMCVLQVGSGLLSPFTPELLKFYSKR